MKDRILFWIDVELIHFGIAKFLKEKYDCDLYSIIDVMEKPRKFFENQKLVDFRKTWYYDEHLPRDEKPDINYLINFEQKYGINLWKIAYSERMFAVPYEYHTFTTNQILSLIERACKFCEKVLDETKPDFFVSKITNMHHNHLFYEICKSKGIKIMMVIPDRFGKRCLIAKESNKIDEFEDTTSSNDITKKVTELQSFIKKYNTNEQTKQVVTKFYAYNPSKIRSWFTKFVLATSDSNFSDHFNHFGQSKTKVLFYAISHIISKKYREFFINRNLSRKIDSKFPFIYHPLHYEPERLYLIDVPYHNNQLSIVSNIAKSLPMGYKLYVKEHPAMALQNWREISFYKHIMNLPNVELIHPSVSSVEMLEKCSLVITIAGTTGLEAAFHKKPSIVFTDLIYSHLPFVHTLGKIEDLPHAIRTSLENNVNLTDLAKYVDIIERNSFELDWVKIQGDIDNYFYYGGVAPDVEISIDKMQLFLEEHRNDFEVLANQHIRKIQRYKQVEKSDYKSSRKTI